MDPILAVLIVIVVLVVAVTGTIRHRHEQQAIASRPRPQPEAVCSCSHGYGLHTEEGCLFVTTEQRKVRDNSEYTMNNFGERRLAKADIEWATVEVPCKCRRYTGPLPLDTIWTPPAIGGM